MAYDIIGDVHGCASALTALLEKMGYRERGGAYHHPTRTVLFLGDFIDRGPEQLRTLDIVRRMVDGGSAAAVLGNHEFNAIAWFIPDGRGGYLRRHSDKNRKQHASFLREAEGRPEHREAIDWFLGLPVWMDLPELRLVHACWHQPFMDYLDPLLADRRLSRELMEPAATEPEDPAEKDTAAPSVFKAVEALTKGLEIPLPVGISFADKDGIPRDRVRIRWWDPGAVTFEKAALLGEVGGAALPSAPIPAHARIRVPDAKPTFFGHYWQRGRQEVLGPSTACVDYSACMGGELCAYRHDGEQVLESGRFVSVPGPQP